MVDTQRIWPNLPGSQGDMMHHTDELLHRVQVSCLKPRPVQPAKETDQFRFDFPEPIH